MRRNQLSCKTLLKSMCGVASRSGIAEGEGELTFGCHACSRVFRSSHRMFTMNIGGSKRLFSPAAISGQVGACQ